MVSENVPTSRHHGAPKHGDALLAGLVRCRRCGRKLTVRYSGVKHNIPRYACHRGLLDDGEPRCIAFGGLRVDDAIEAALLEVVEPGAIALSGNTTRPIPRTASSQRSLRRGGTGRSRALARPRPKSPLTTAPPRLGRSRGFPPSRRWPMISRPSGKRRRPMPGSRSASSAP